MKALRLPEQKIPNARRFWSRRYFIKNDGNQSINERRIEEAAFDPEMTANGAGKAGFVSPIYPLPGQTAGGLHEANLSRTDPDCILDQNNEAQLCFLPLLMRKRLWIWRKN